MRMGLPCFVEKFPAHDRRPRPVPHLGMDRHFSTERAIEMRCLIFAGQMGRLPLSAISSLKPRHKGEDNSQDGIGLPAGAGT